MPTPPTSRPKADPTSKKRAIRRLNSGPTHSRDLIVPRSGGGDPARARGRARERRSGANDEPRDGRLLPGEDDRWRGVVS
jgi:hypothetical protein